MDLKNDIKTLDALAPIVIGSDTTTNGIEIDTNGFESLTFLLRASSYTDGTFTASLEESDVSGSGYTAVDSVFVIGEVALTAAGVASIGSVAKKRYIRLVITSTAVTTGTTLDSLAVLGSPRHAAVA